jgi:hypothetical protein
VVRDGERMVGLAGQFWRGDVRRLFPPEPCWAMAWQAKAFGALFWILGRSN